MNTYYVYKHDKWTKPTMHNVLEEGYHVTLNPEGFRNLPLESIHWSVKVVANDRQEALRIAKLKRN